METVGLASAALGAGAALAGAVRVLRAGAAAFLAGAGFADRVGRVLRTFLARLFAFALGRGFGRGADGRCSGSVLGCCCVR